jgi:hypothetical protein
MDEGRTSTRDVSTINNTMDEGNTSTGTDKIYLDLNECPIENIVAKDVFEVNTSTVTFSVFFYIKIVMKYLLTTCRYDGDFKHHMMMMMMMMMMMKEIPNKLLFSLRNKLMLFIVLHFPKQKVVPNEDILKVEKSYHII